MKTGTEPHAVFPDFSNIQRFPVCSQRAERHVRCIPSFRRFKNGEDPLPVFGAERRIVESQERRAVGMLGNCSAKLSGWVSATV